MSGISVSDIVKSVQFAWNIYRMGWGEDFDASQQYQDFGDDVKNLSENLKSILRIVENAKNQQPNQSGRFRGQPVQKDWDLSSLREIIGDYDKTLADCQKLLDENHEFKKSRNFAYNIDWNLVIQPKVEQLRRRLRSHNSKILILLKPLELNLLSDIHQDLVERIDVVHQSVLRLQGLLIPDVEQALSEQGRVISIPLTVPADIEKIFQTAAEKSQPEIRTPGNFPLQAGADAFVAHLEESTKIFTAGNFINERTPPPKQYLSLLKCIWILRRLQESDELRNTPKDSQWRGYIEQLNEDLSTECRRFTAPSAQRLVAPDLSSPRHADEYNIWLEENIAKYISPHFEAYMEEVLKIPMPSPPGSLHHDMTIYRLESTKYRLLESVNDKNAPSARHQEEFKMDIDLKSVNLTPIYATPSSRPKSLEVLIHSASTHTNPTFQELKHVLRVQHLLTGYKVYDRYDQPMVKVSFFVSGQSIKEHGRLQLWLPHPFNSSSDSTSLLPSTAQSSARSSRVSVNKSIESLTSDYGSQNRTLPGNSRQNITPMGNSLQSTTLLGNTMQSMTSLGNSRENTTHSRRSSHSLKSTARHRNPSVTTNSSSRSRSTVTSITTISTDTGRAYLHKKPAKPLLVIFLKSQDAAAKLAIAAIQIDDNTEVKRERCGCRRQDSLCLDSCIERSKGCLLVQRWDANQGLGSWNLAKLGLEQRKELPADAWNDVERVTMKFDSIEDRNKFSGSLCPCKPKMQHDLSRCVLSGHHGVFGIVKQIGSQALRNYHDEREKSAKTSMVLGSLPEDELLEASPVSSNTSIREKFD